MKKLINQIACHRSTQADISLISDDQISKKSDGVLRGFKVGSLEDPTLVNYFDTQYTGRLGILITVIFKNGCAFEINSAAHKFSLT